MITARGKKRLSALKLMIAFLSLSLAVCLTSCGQGSSSGDVPPICTASIEAGIVIKVIDADTGAGIVCESQAVIEEGAYREVIDAPVGPTCSDSGTLAGAFERTGVYTVTVTKAGYLTWSRDNIIVTANPCHVNTVTVEALMQK